MVFDLDERLSGVSASAFPNSNMGSLKSCIIKKGAKSTIGDSTFRHFASHMTKILFYRKGVT